LIREWNFFLRGWTCPGGLPDKSEKILLESNVEARHLCRNFRENLRNWEKYERYWHNPHRIISPREWNTWYYYVLPIHTTLDLIWWLGLRERYSRNLTRENENYRLRSISSLMTSQQAIKVNYSHEWINIVTKTEKLQIFLKIIQANNSR
jgi:hypothetical protein